MNIYNMIEDGFLFALNDSGGKDSQAMRIVVRQMVPAKQIIVVHATLGEAEWPGALEHARDNAHRDGFPFIVAQATKTFFEMVDRRFETRPDAPCWPSSDCRQCTSDLKRDPIQRELRRYMREHGLTKIVNCVGLRADESSGRAKLMTMKRSERNSKAGRDWYEWLPIHKFTREHVLKTVADAGEQLHPAYAAGNDRLSCMFCIMGSKKDLRNAALANPDLYRRYVERERTTGYTMHQSRIALPQLTGVRCP